MKYYKFRIDDVFDENVYKTLETYFSAYIRGREGIENPHFHYYVEMDVPIRTFRSCLKRLGVCGNRCYSLRELNEEKPLEYIAYILKEDTNFTSLNISEDVIGRGVEYDKHIKAVMKNKVKKSKWKDIYLWIEEKNGGDILNLFKDIDGRNKTLPVRKILHEVLDYFEENELIVREFLIVSYVQTILLNCGYGDIVFDRILEKLIKI